MGISKKHYEDIAEMIGTCEDLESLTNMLVGYFKADNHLFDEGRFMEKVKKSRGRKGSDRDG